MRLVVRLALSIGAVVLFTGCDTAQSQFAAPGAVQQSRAIATHAKRSGSWMLPEAKSADLLFVSDAGANRINVLTYPQGLLVGSFVYGVAGPQGECVDSAGDVYVANSSFSNVLLYKRNYLDQPFIIKDPGYYPTDCAIDPTTEDLAVANSVTIGSNAGSVAIWTDISYPPVIYTIPNFYWYYYCGYDDNGNLFIDGMNHAYAVEIAELRKGSNTFEAITLNKPLKSPGPIQWDGKYIALGDSAAGVIYRLEINGSNATVVGSTKFKTPKPLDEFSIVRGKTASTIIAGGYAVGRYPCVHYWNYPKGGSPTKNICGFRFPFGVAVSLAPGC